MSVVDATVRSDIVDSHRIDCPDEVVAVLAEVAAERRRQDERWGEQNHPDGTGPTHSDQAVLAREECERAADTGHLSWRHILLEEVAEANEAHESARLRQELIQVAAVAVAWAQAIDRRAKGTCWDVVADGRASGTAKTTPEPSR